MSIRIVASTIARASRSHESGIIAKSIQSTRRQAPISLRFRGKSSAAAADASATKTAKASAEGASKEAAAASEASSSSESVPIDATFIAMTLAIATVSAGAAVAENATASMVPKFDPKSQRFDQSTFMGRFSKMLLGCDPSLLACSGAEVQRCKDLVDDYENQLKNLPEGVSEIEMSRKLWEAQVSSTCFVSGETIEITPVMPSYSSFSFGVCALFLPIARCWCSFTSRYWRDHSSPISHVWICPIQWANMRSDGRISINFCPALLELGQSDSERTCELLQP